MHTAKFFCLILGLFVVMAVTSRAVPQTVAAQPLLGFTDTPTATPGPTDTPTPTLIPTNTPIPTDTPQPPGPPPAGPEATPTPVTTPLLPEAGSADRPARNSTAFTLLLIGLALLTIGFAWATIDRRRVALLGVNRIMRSIRRRR